MVWSDPDLVILEFEYARQVIGKYVKATIAIEACEWTVWQES